MKSKNVKIPVELVELIVKRDPDRPPGEVLLDIVNDYLKLEDYARSLKLELTGKETVSEILIKYHKWQDENTESVKKQIDELKSMIKGTEKFFTEFGKGK